MTSRAIGRIPAPLFDQNTWDIGGISACFRLSNRSINVSSMRTNDEFCLVRRVPREK